MSAVPDVRVKGGFGPALTVTIIAGLAVLLVLGATVWWLGRIQTH
jgi:hypothetical protein